jgi:hypothetical protein
MNGSPITAHPLTWPTGWPRTQPVARLNAHFGARKPSRYGGNFMTKQDLTINEGLGRVLGQLDRLGVERQDVIVSTNVPTRLDGMPRSGAARPDDPGVAVYWATKAGTRVMAVDRYLEVADNLAAVAATLDALRAIERHGGAQILDRAFTGFAAIPAQTGGAPSWRDLFGPGDYATVEAKYKAAAMAAHPDRGGDHEQMVALNTAWDQARKWFSENGVSS